MGVAGERERDPPRDLCKYIGQHHGVAGQAEARHEHATASDGVDQRHPQAGASIRWDCILSSWQG